MLVIVKYEKEKLLNLNPGWISPSASLETAEESFRRLQICLRSDPVNQGYWKHNNNNNNKQFEFHTKITCKSLNEMEECV